MWRNLKKEPALKSIGKRLINKKREAAQICQEVNQTSVLPFNGIDLETGSYIFSPPGAKREPGFKPSIQSRPADDHHTAHLSAPSHCHPFEAEVLFFGATRI